jgi:hypothetical protein
MRVIEYRINRWVGHVARVGDKEMCTMIDGEIGKIKDHLENLCVGGRIILKWIFKKWDEGSWTGMV